MKDYFSKIFYKIKGKLFYRYVVDYPPLNDDDGFKKYEEIYNWLVDNNLHNKQSMLSYHKLSTYVENATGYKTLIKLTHKFEFRFKREEDAVLFKLRWLDD